MAPSRVRVCWLLILLSHLVYGSIYIAQNGVDDPTCGDQSSPCATLSQGVLLGCERTDNETMIILVEPGVYQSPLQSINCSLAIRSTQGANQTFLQESSEGGGISVDSAVNFTLDGFTISSISLTSSWLNCSSITNQIVISDIQLDPLMTAPLVVLQSPNLHLRELTLSDLYFNESIIATAGVQNIVATDFTVTNCTCPVLLRITANGSSLRVSQWVVRNSSFIPFSSCQSMELSSITFDKTNLSSTAWENTNMTITDSVWSDIWSEGITIRASNHLDLENVTFAAFHCSDPYIALTIFFDSALATSTVTNCHFYQIRQIETRQITLVNSSVEDVVVWDAKETLQMTNVSVINSWLLYVEAQSLDVESCFFIWSNISILPSIVASNEPAFRFYQTQIANSQLFFPWVDLERSPPPYRVVFYHTEIAAGYVDSRFALEFQDCTITQAVSLTYSSELLFNHTMIMGASLSTIYSAWNFYRTPTVLFYNSTVLNNSIAPYQVMILCQRVVLQNSTFIGNYVGSYGALIRMDELLSMEDCIFVNNRGDHGSVLVEISGTSMTSHHNIVYANNTLGDGTLLVAMDTTTLNLERIYFNDNQCMNLVHCGGSSTCQFQDCQFKNNNSTAVAFDGNANAQLNRTIFHNNIAAQGGAVASGGSAQLRCEHCLFHGNQAYAGGAIFARDLSKVYLINSDFASNVAKSSGGACNLGNQGVTVAINSTFQNNQAKIGGATSCEKCNLVMNDTSFVHNIAEHGGAIAFSSAGVGYISRCLFDSNIAGQYGGASFLSSSGSVDLVQCEMTSNMATYGGASYVSDSGTMRILDGSVHNNTATIYGGGVYQAAPTSVEITRVNITHNNATAGGGVFAEYPQLNVTQSFFISNNASGWGGAVMLTTTTDSLISFDSTAFIDNKSFQGGAVAITTSQSQVVSYATFRGCRFYENRALAGGAICSDYARSVFFEPDLASEFINNTALVYGGALNFKLVDTSFPILRNAIFVNNSANLAGGAVMVISLGGKAPSNGPSIPGTLCNNSCVYSDNTSPGYQTKEGWASNPSQLVFTGNSPCGQEYTLDENLEPFEVTVVDSFGTPVHGGILERVPFDVKVSYVGSGTYPSAGFLQMPMDTNTGNALFLPFDFCALSGSTVSLSAQAINDTSRLFHRFSIQPITSCTFSIGGCNQTGYQPATDPDNYLCEVCQPVPIFDWKTVTLVLSSLFLCFLLLAVIGVFVAYKSYRRMKYRIYESMEIPDIVGNSTALSLKEVLQNSTVRVLDWNDLVIGDPLGRGAFGVVSRGTYQGEPVAIKELILGIDEHQSEEFTDFLKEIVVMSSLTDPNIVAFVGVAVPPDQSRLCLVTELMERGSVHDLIAKKGENLNQKMRYHLAAGAALGIAHLHVKNLIHRDLKTDNLLVDRAWTCKVADFGISTLFQDTERRRTCIGTPTYMAPEVLTRENYTHKADVFSFGVVLYELFSGKRAYSDSEHATMSVAVLNDAILQGARPDASILEEPLQSLVERCWAHNPQDRPAFKEIYNELQRLSR